MVVAELLTLSDITGGKIPNVHTWRNQVRQELSAKPVASCASLNIRMYVGQQGWPACIGGADIYVTCPPGP
jgi:hypothetical protein